MSKFPLRRFLLPSVLVLTAVLATGEARAQGGDARVPVVHGVPDLPVDVYVNHELTREGVEPATITDPLTFPAGDYTIDVREAGRSVVRSGDHDLLAHKAPHDHPSPRKPGQGRCAPG